MRSSAYLRHPKALEGPACVLICNSDVLAMNPSPIVGAQVSKVGASSTTMARTPTPNRTFQKMMPGRITYANQSASSGRRNRRMSSCTSEIARVVSPRLVTCALVAMRAAPSVLAQGATTQ